ncbi:MAG: AAA family ATPase [Dechloromonas sp.]|nr:AAA family ATPase [Dechloromonas sp.]
MSLDTALKRPALYNPALWSRDEVRTYYVARPKLLARFIDDLRREKPGTRPQHRLILGQRGMGKSTLLRRLAIAVDDDNELAAAWIPLVFPEEQYNVGSLADFWLNCLDALGDYLESHGRTAEMNAIDAEVERLDRKDGEGALQTLLRIAEKLGRRLILLVDNIDLILDRLKDKDWALREALQEYPQLMLIGASSRALEASYDYGRAFYDFFRIDELRGLSENEMRETIVNLARLRGAEELIQRLQADPGRLRVLHTLTGGNPRTAVLLYGVLLKGADGDVRSDLEGLLDEVTPLYKARFDELAPQAQQLLDKVALHWDPMTARQVADALGWEINPTSAQLDRLVQAGVIEKVKSGRGKRVAFQVAERFFNIWYLMRASRRVRRKLMWLVEFLRVSFSGDELQSLARARLVQGETDTAEAEYMLAISRAIGPAPISRALETHALDCLIQGGRTHLEEILDLSGEESDLATKAENIKARKAAKSILEKLLKGDSGKAILDQLLGLPIGARQVLELAKAYDAASPNELKPLKQFVEEQTKAMSEVLGGFAFQKLSKAISTGHMESPKDEVGGDSAAMIYDYPLLGWIAKLYNVRSNNTSAIDTEKLARLAIEQEPGGALYWLYLAEALLAQEKTEQSLAPVRKALEIAPKNVGILQRAARVLEKCPSTQEEAEGVYRTLLSLEPNNTATMRRMILLLRSGGRDQDEMIGLARILCDQEPNKPYNWFLLAGAMAGKKDAAEEMLSALNKMLELAPSDIFGLAMLSATLFKIGRLDDAISSTRGMFENMGNNRENLEIELQVMIALLKVVCVKNAAPALLKEMDTTEAGERFRPAREALAAVVAGTADVLNSIAPEVRKPAMDVLAIIAPELVPPEM